MSQTHTPHEPVTPPAAPTGEGVLPTASATATVPRPATVPEPIVASVAAAPEPAAVPGPTTATVAPPAAAAAPTAPADVAPAPADAAAEAAAPKAPARGVRTYRGRTLEELLDPIREELGEDAVILRRREGLTGGVGGFFQQRFVEVEAVAGDAFGGHSGSFDSFDDEPATPEPTATPAAAPAPGRRGYADLPTFEAAVQDPDDRRPAAPAGSAEPFGGPAFLQHLDAARERIRERTGPADDLAALAAEPTARVSVDVDVAEYGLVARGLPAALARSVVAEAADHGLPLDAGHRLDRATRAILARRLPRIGERTAVRTIAIVGAPGVGRTAAIAALATAYAAAGRRTLAVALDAADGGAALSAALVGTQAEVLATRSGGAVTAAARANAAEICLIDAPAVDPTDAEGARALAAVLRTAGVDEVHLALSAADSGAESSAAVSGLAALGADAIVMTNRDRSQRPGAIVGVAIERQLPISYLSSGDAIATADPARLARMVQP